MPLLHEALGAAVKHVKTKHSYKDDSIWSVFHYKIVFSIVLVCCIASGLTSWYEPMYCTKVDAKDISEKVMTQWCYALSTFTVQGHYNSSMPGIYNSEADPSNKKKHITYYQWVTIVLLFQAVAFQVPRFLWKAFEGGQIQSIASTLKDLETASEEERSRKISNLAAYFHRRRNLDRGASYSLTYAFCQSLYLLNICVQIMITDCFLNKNFLMLLPKWLEAKSAILDRVFPKVAKCIFTNFGTSGNEQKHDSICILAMNVLIEKIYLILWIVFAITFVISVMQIMCLITSFAFRKRNQLRGGGYEDVPSMFSNSDRLLLSFIESSVDCLVYEELIDQLRSEKV